MARPVDAPTVLLHPSKNIAKALGLSPTQVWHWIKHYGLPIFHLPDGQVATTVGLIEEWAREHRTRQLSQPVSGSKHSGEKLRKTPGGKCGRKMEMVR